MSSDGGLRALYRQYLKGWQLTAVESPITSPGVPDTEYCSLLGHTGWIENKKTNAWAVKIRTLQVGWISRRARLGGRVFIAVRRMSKGKDQADELWIIRGQAVEILADQGLRAVAKEDVLLRSYDRGPASWEWDQVAKILQRFN